MFKFERMAKYAEAAKEEPILKPEDVATVCQPIGWGVSGIAAHASESVVKGFYKNNIGDFCPVETITASLDAQLAKFIGKPFTATTRKQIEETLSAAYFEGEYSINS